MIINERKQIMKTKQQMIDIIMLEEKQLWLDYEECLEIMGEEHEITQNAMRRWGAVNELLKKLGL